MNFFDDVGFYRRELAGPAAPNGAGASIHRRTGFGRHGRLWSAIARPFHKSISIRFHYAFGFAMFGLVLMAAITFVSNRVLVNTYESGVAEARFEMMPAQLLQTSLREAEHLTYLYAIEGDLLAPFHYNEVAATVNRQFEKMTEGKLLFGSLEHAHSGISIPKTEEAWQAAQAAALRVFEHAPRTTAAAEAQSHAHMAIDPVYDAISEFHHGSMQDSQERLRYAHSVADWAYIAISGAIVIGLCVLIAIRLVVGRSVLRPIMELQVAARSLAEKDFSHRVRLRNTRDELGQLGRAFNIASATLQRVYEELERRSTHDGLTGALNRTAFDVRLSEECRSADRHGRPLSLLMVDIDFFKLVNDNHGHQTGDRLLQILVRLLNESVRPGDVVARYGGEEFVIILPDTGEGSALAMAERVRRTIEDHSFNGSGDETIGITVSVGCASRRRNTMEPEDFVKTADAALYRAKKTGRNRVVSASGFKPTSGIGRETAAA